MLIAWIALMKRIKGRDWIDQQGVCHINPGKKGTKGVDQGYGSGGPVKWAAVWG